MIARSGDAGQGGAGCQPGAQAVASVALRVDAGGLEAALDGPDNGPVGRAGRRRSGHTGDRPIRDRGQRGPGEIGPDGAGRRRRALGQADLGALALSRHDPMRYTYAGVHVRGKVPDVLPFHACAPTGRFHARRKRGDSLEAEMTAVPGSDTAASQARQC
jgi:hypothetical protein